MFSLGYLTAILFPKRSLDDQQRIVDAAVALGEYYEPEWQTVTFDQLSNLDVQARLIKTVHQSQFGYWGVIRLILDSLDTWDATGAQRVVVDEEVLEFYRRLFPFVVFLHFDALPVQYHVAVLTGYGLPLAALWDVPVILNVTRYFESLVYLDQMELRAELYAESIEKNEEVLAGKAITAWVQQFKEAPAARPEVAADDFFVDNVEVDRLDDAVHNALKKVITLYFLCKTGAIYRDTSENFAAGVETQEPIPDVTLADEYIDALGRVPDMSLWLERYEDAVLWIVGTQQSERFVQKLLFLLSERVDLSDPYQVQQVIFLLQKLQEGGLEGVQDLVYFDEKQNEFVWDVDTITSFDLPESQEVDRGSLAEVSV